MRKPNRAGPTPDAALLLIGRASDDWFATMSITRTRRCWRLLLSSPLAPD
jgi:hypothetical protein